MSVEDRYPSERLFADTQHIAYPEDVLPVPELIPGLASSRAAEAFFRCAANCPRFRSGK
jgi:hypothetical protein